MFNLIVGVLMAALSILMVVSGVRKQRVKIPLPIVDDLWGVNREDLPFFYWLGLVLWALAGLGFSAWGILSL